MTARRRTIAPMICKHGHRVIESTGECYTMTVRKIDRDRFMMEAEYVHGPCAAVCEAERRAAEKITGEVYESKP
jgi:ribosomal protein L16/L10AE